MYALVGSGEYLPPMKPVDRYLISKLAQSPRVVCLPTAAGNEGDERIDYWSNLGVEHFTRLGAEVESLRVIDHESANNKAFADIVSLANFVYLSGGRPNYLYDTLKNTRVWEAITSVLENGGILTGCSAGAMIMGQEFFSFDGSRSGFNFIPGAMIMPHFDEIPEARLQRRLEMLPPDLTLLGIDGNTALIKCDDQYEVAGSGCVTVWNRSGKIHCPAGPLPANALWENA